MNFIDKIRAAEAKLVAKAKKIEHLEEVMLDKEDADEYIKRLEYDLDTYKMLLESTSLMICEKAVYLKDEWYDMVDRLDEETYTEIAVFPHEN
jgi:hypothetical protein